MEKISIKNIIDFRRKSQKSKITFVNNLNKPKKPSESGGDYWISCLSAISNSFKYNSNINITEKIDELEFGIDATPHKITKTMYQRNIDILYNFEDYDFTILKPTSNLTFLKKPKSISILNIHGLPIQVLPNHVYSFEENGARFIGAIWFVAKLDGYKKDEIALFTEGIYKYLEVNHSDEYLIHPKHCIAIDVNTCKEVNYLDILNNKNLQSLESSVDLIKELI
ncbi:hypothetical protein [Chryseobacterium sp. 18068]|uniref:hypothetical protein n=1 Tax=Chryseobacterium sp. 18068 TaxID=2681414 RepID=UPI00135781C2|nr:hypothetical protein [Chryseobacterium sp. 18068]